VDFRGRHVVVTGGTGALGVAVVGTLLDTKPMRKNSRITRTRA
jgi:FlaA1/EpsC-like NDP-sugar epimerase